MFKEINGRIVAEVIPECVGCPLNTYQDKVGGPECIPCPSNHVTLTTETKTVTDCIGKCYKCFMYYIYYVGLCPPNYNSSTGLAPCEPCPKGMYQPEYGELYCIPCQSEEDNVACIISKNRDIGIIW